MGQDSEIFGGESQIASNNKNPSRNLPAGRQGGGFIFCVSNSKEESFTVYAETADKQCDCEMGI